MSRPYAEVIGDPIAHSKSPLIHDFWLRKLGIDAEYRACHVKPEELADYFAARRKDPDWRGCNVTIPHKEHIAALLDEVDPRARKIGAVNTVWPIENAFHGRNTDVEGVAEALRGLDLAEQGVVVIGAGGAARAAFAYLEGLTCKSVKVIARNLTKAEGVVSDFALPSKVHSFDETEAIDEAALLVNATQLGMLGQPPMPSTVLAAIDSMAANGHVFDMVYSPQETELLKSAARCGRYPVGGLTMLIGQARTAFARFFGKAPPPQYDNDLRKLLTE